MSKRTDAIRAMFTQPVAEELSADNRPADARRVSAGAVRAIQNTFSDIEVENEELRARLRAGENAADIAPELIDASPFADRFEFGDDAAFEQLKQSIAERGQEIPVLVRVHPTAPNRFQTAYGHRRIRAAQALGRPVKAIVRELTDDDLVVAQGLENSAREDLSFIERAVFALRLEETGRARGVIQQALAIDKAELSKLIAVAKAVPGELVRAIGKAPKVGRPRWLECAEAMKDNAARMRAISAIAADGFSKLDSDERFARVLSAAQRRPSQKAAAVVARRLSDSAGRPIGEMRASDRNIKLILEQPTGQAFADFLSSKLPGLYEEFRVAGAQSGVAKES
jgi:ParB family transcriptional regulator, chromosome partitioning protein